MWPVFFVIVDTGEPTYKVFYKWKERANGPFSLQSGTAEGSLSVVNFGGIKISLDPKNPDRALAWGNFPTPRTANLKRLTTASIEKLDTKDID